MSLKRRAHLNLLRLRMNEKKEGEKIDKNKRN
jgi:hypothetical protein